MLTDAERELLKALGEEWKDWEELAEKVGNRDKVARTLYFLSQKGLAEMKEEKGEELVLTPKGKEALEKGLEEEQLLKEGIPVKDLPLKVRERLGLLKRSGRVSIEGGVVRIHDKPYILREALLSLAEGKEVDRALLKELERDGLVERRSYRRIWGRITEKGLAEREKEGGIGTLTKEMLEKGSWKGRPFRPFNIDLSAVKQWGGGYRHVVRKAIEEIREVFSSMGFEEMSGPYVESAFWNFDALFQPQDHPSRELADTFYLEGKASLPEGELVERVAKAHEAFWRYRWERGEAGRLVLRTHTTVLSAKTLISGKRGKFFAVGKVFRNEAIDYKHLAEFHQVEGIVAEKGVTFKHLLGILKEFYSRLGFEEIRFRPSYFPYTEPSLEIEVWFEPKQEWVELGGAGMFRREMLDAWGVKENVLAWGLSLERPLMMLLGLSDIRDLYRNDRDFLRGVRLPL